uniref:Uncharacterized protein n=1 Tax=Methanococcus maripaludis (strain C6 / ATCC BAA-1332) TaxID=444158 RepID=A9A7J8_METM6
MKYTFKFIIPSKYKNKIRKELEVLGIHSGTLFPELENYGRFLRDKHLSN